MKRPEINIPATKVFYETMAAIEAKAEDGQRKYKLINQEGSSRSSKTWSDFLVLHVYGYENPLKVITVLRDTATDCRDIVETEWVKWLSDPCCRLQEFEEGKITVQQLNAYLRVEDMRRLYSENKTKHIWTNKATQSTTRFTGLDDDDKVMGMTQSVCWVNEPYNFAHEVYRQLSQRTSDFMLVDWNPKKAHWLHEEQKKENTIVLKSTFRDNPFCPKGMKDQILSYQPLSMSEAVLNKLITTEQARTCSLDGLTPYQSEEIVRCRYNESTGSASEFHWSVYGLGVKAERPNRIFKWQEISTADYRALSLPVYYGSDWGAVDPWAVGEAKYSDGCLYVHEHNYDSENVIRGKLTPTELAQIGVVDEGLVSWKFAKFGVDRTRPVVCDPNRVTKIRALRTAGYEYAIAAQKPPGSIIDGIDLLNNLKVFYTSDSPNIKHEQENYSRQVDRYGIVLEEPEDFDNHHMDWIRYVGMYLQQIGVIQKV